MDPQQRLLTEHLGFAPLTLIDEVINSVNHIIYNCLDGLDRFLVSKRESQIQELRNKSTDNSDIMLDDEEPTNPEFRRRVFPLEDIKKGTAELETLLVSHVDRAFDKFELYTLRNILYIPPDLVSGGWVRLKHHKGLNLSVQDDPSRDKEIRQLMEKINLELTLRKILQLQKAKATKLVSALKHYRSCVAAIVSSGSQSQLSPEKKTTLRQHLEPMNENLYYLLGQTDTLLEQTLKLEQKLKSGNFDGSSECHFTPSLRDVYMNHKSLKLLSECGVIKDGEQESSRSFLYSAVAETPKGTD
ncbi:hypothetical protein ACI3LY_000046 [Candidozyma auris]|uniref:Mis12 domain-containing protein n=2 Tax=Candidozyma auris TaxID=498019 RepID=A0A2H1A5Z5_CANAR|nr:MIND complex subunit MTW1 [[Candida] auris]KNE00086.2 hypothetical protein QG37_03033 [[Candida] auris]PIS57973.1 hypothetical protein CJI97_001029 [[Candida] auris]PIS58509.1 hypothetical protein B9J08_001009 [[Candida] auris]QEO20581.1 hypothetical_protein [[Candida] auris]QWW23741.1 hypothetical protein CA7LBN_002542 [[Candida] auris]